MRTLQKHLFTLLTAIAFAGVGYAQPAIKFTTGFDVSPPYEGFESHNGCCVYSHTTNTVTRRTGAGSVEFLMYNNDPPSPSGSNRTEITYDAPPTDSTLRWFQYYTYMPAGGWDNDPDTDIFSQWHDYSTGCSTSPPLSFTTTNGQIYLVIRYNLTSPSYCSDLNASRRMSFPVGPVTIGSWVKWTIYYRPALDGAGDIIVWRDGVVIFRTTGPNDFRGTQPHYWKFGIYKWSWASAGDGGSTATSRKILFDDMIIGTKTATVANFEPSAPTGDMATGQNKSIATGINTLALTGPSSTGGFPSGYPQYQWQTVTGPVTPTFSSTTGTSTNVQNMTADGVYVVRLKISSSATIFNYEYFSIKRGTGAAPNMPPVATNTTPSVVNNTTTTIPLSVSASDPEAGPLTYLWTQLSGPATTLTTPTAASCNATGATPGNYQYQVVITDNAANSVTVTANVIVNFTPVPDAGPFQQLTAGTTSFDLDGSVIDSDDPVISIHTWSLMSGPNTPTYTATDWNPHVTGAVNGVYVFKLTVQDSQGAIGEDVVTIQINNPPTINVSGNPTSAPPTGSINLVSTIADPDGTVSTIQWYVDSGPGTPVFGTPTSNNTTVTGTVQGSYIFRVRATDNLGAFTDGFVNVTVQSCAPCDYYPKKNRRKRAI